jgi:predicted nucleic acid-binding Zn ribbon protein
MKNIRGRQRLSGGRWQLERERYQLPADCTPPAYGELTPVGEVIVGVIKRVGLDARVWEQSILDAWVELVGEAVARRARPGYIQNGVLTVFVSNAAWMNELVRFGKKALLEKLQSRFGAARIRDIRFAPDPDVQAANRFR